MSAPDDSSQNICHELRNPLAVTISPVGILLNADHDESAEKKLYIVLRNTRKMQVMIVQWLEFSEKAKSGDKAAPYQDFERDERKGIRRRMIIYDFGSDPEKHAELSQDFLDWQDPFSRFVSINPGV